MKFGLPLAFFFCTIFINKAAYSQSKEEDSILFETAISNTISIYNQQLGDQSPVYNGSHYVKPPFTFKTGSPYFLSDTFARNSSVVYDDIQFDSLALLYEDLRELLVSKSTGYLLQLVNQRILSFKISGHKFIRLVSDSLNPGITNTGFYELLYQGRSTVLKKTIKNIVEEANVTEGVLEHIEVSYQYYIKKNHSYMQVKTKRELFEAFSDHEKDIRHYIKKNKLRFKRDRERTIVQAAVYYDLTTH
jgi:hypothetical protein